MVRRSARKMSRKFHSRLEERGAVGELLGEEKRDEADHGAALF